MKGGHFLNTTMHMPEPMPELNKVREAAEP